MNGFAHHMGESTVIFRGISPSKFELLFHFLIYVNPKQNSPRLDATFCGVTSGAILFASVPQKGCQAKMS